MRPRKRRDRGWTRKAILTSIEKSLSLGFSFDADDGKGGKGGKGMKRLMCTTITASLLCQIPLCYSFCLYWPNLSYFCFDPQVTAFMLYFRTRESSPSCPHDS